MVQYALLIDEINKEILKHNLGSLEEGIAEIIAYCLLWMDDVALIATDPTNLQIMLDITNETSNRYHVEFGEPKSRILKIGKGKTNVDFTLGEMKLQYTEKYDYLGEILNSKGNLTDHIVKIKGKTEAAYQTLLALAGNKQFHNIEMKAIWKMVEACIIPITTYAGETRNQTIKENKEINGILDNIIKRILMVPRTTPREVLYIETGLMDVEHLCIRNRINMEKRLNMNQDSITYKVKENGAREGWKTKTNDIMQKIGITPRDMEGSKERTKQIVNSKDKQKFDENIEISGRDKSKVRYLLDGKQDEWKPGKPAQYITNMTRYQASIIFKAKTRMLDVKNNFRNKNHDNICRACSTQIETQDHVLNECTAIHRDGTLKVTREDLNSDNMETLHQVCKKIEAIMTRLEQPQ